MTRIVLSLTLALGISQFATGQQPAVDQGELKRLQAEVKRLRLQVEQLQALFRQLGAGQSLAGGDMGHLLVMPGFASRGALLTLTAKDAEAIGRECSAVRSVAPLIRTRTDITVAHKRWVPSFIYGTTPAFLDVRAWTGLKEGEPFTEADVRNQARVCLIGQTIKRKLFDNRSPLGREIRLANVAFKVVGVLSERGATVMGLDQDDIVVAPWTSIKARVASNFLTDGKQGADGLADTVTSTTTVKSLNQLYPGTKTLVYPTVDPLQLVSFDQIVVRAKSTKEIPAAIRQIADLLRQRHRIKKGQPDDFDIHDMTELVKILRPDKMQK
jgi:hypothetical protein